jgi:hypothetical protein
MKYTIKGPNTPYYYKRQAVLVNPLVGVHSSGAEHVVGVSLYQNFPNPFNPSTSISFALAHDARVSLRIYDLLGHEIATLIDGVLNSGFHTIQWHPDDLASGI